MTARFRIENTLRGQNGYSTFEVTLLSGTLTVGDTFYVRDADHHWLTSVRAISAEGSGLRVTCDMEIAWDGQFAEVVVDTSVPASVGFTRVAPPTGSG